MAEPQKVWNKHKITAIIIMLVVTAYILPAYIESDCSAFNTPESLGKSISKYIEDHDVHAKVVQTKQIEKDLFVSFTDERYPDFMGIAIFQPGSNFMWQPIDVTYGNKPSIDSYSYSYTEDSKINTVFYGIDIDPRIASFKGENYEQEPIFDRLVTEPNFMEFYVIDKPMYRLSFFDSAGNNITPELLKEYDVSGPEYSWFFKSMFGTSNSDKFGTYLFYFFAALYTALYIGTRNPNPIRYYDENAGKKERETNKGLANKWKNVSLRKQAALIILIVSVLAVVIIYSADFSISLPEDNLTKIIEDYTFTEDTKLTILKTERDGNRLFVLCRADNPYYISLAYLERGFNGRWRITGCSEYTGMCISSFGNHYYDGSDHMIIVGVECDPRAVSYEFIYNHPYNAEKEPVVVYSNNVTEPNFIHIYETGNYWNTRLKIYDANGENIELELSKKYSEDVEMQGGGGRGGPEGVSMNSTFAIIIIINLIAFWAVWIEKPKQK